MQVDDGDNEIKNAPNFQDVRLFKVGRRTSTTPHDEVEDVFTQWARPTTCE